MRALVIGGNKYFGKRLVGQLLEQGARVTLLNRGNLDDGFGDRVARIRMDRKLLARELPRLDATGSTRKSGVTVTPAAGARPDLEWDVVYDQVCFDAEDARGACQALKDRVGHYVLTSTQSVYGLGSMIPESAFDPRSFVFDRVVSEKDSYGEAKRQAEYVFHREAPFTITSVRLPMVLGEDELAGKLLFHVARVIQGKPIFFPNIDAKLSFIHSADAARALATFAKQPFDGPINACSMEPLCLRDLIHLIELITRLPATLLEPHPRLVDPKAASPFGADRDWTMDASLLKKHGFEARPISEWLPSLIEHFVPGAEAVETEKLPFTLRALPKG